MGLNDNRGGTLSNTVWHSWMSGVDKGVASVNGLSLALFIFPVLVGSLGFLYFPPLQKPSKKYGVKNHPCVGVSGAESESFAGTGPHLTAALASLFFRRIPVSWLTSF